jgi:hypothetical protein
VGEGHVPCPSARLLNPPPPPVHVIPAPAPHPKRFRSIALLVVIVVIPGGAALIALFFSLTSMVRTTTRYMRTMTTNALRPFLTVEVEVAVQPLSRYHYIF